MHKFIEHKKGILSAQELYVFMILFKILIIRLCRYFISEVAYT